MPLVCVLGSGIIGLTAAKSLVDSGYDVVVVARDLPGDPGGLAWSSPSAGAVIYPTSAGKDEAQKFEVEAYKHFWALAHRDPTSGANIVPVTEYFENIESYSDDSQAWYMKVRPYYRHVPADELPAGLPLGMTLTTIVVNPLVYLPWLQMELEDKGVKFIRFTAISLAQVLGMTKASVLINASGLGAGKLCNDDAVTPIRGQALFVRNRREFTQVLLRQGSEYTYVIPRFASGGILVGGVRQEGILHEEADPGLRKDILRRANIIAKGALSDVDLDTDVEDIVGFRPGRKGGFRLEIEGGNVVHAYGFDGVGYVCSFGAAKRVTELVKQLVGKKAKL